MNNVAQTTNDIKNGSVLNLDGQLWTVMKFQHVKPGKGPAFVRTTIKNVLSGKIVDKTFNAGMKMEFGAGDQNLALTGVFRLVEHEVRVSAPCVEQGVIEAGLGHALQEHSGNDLVGIDVGAAQRHAHAGQCGEFFHNNFPFGDLSPSQSLADSPLVRGGSCVLTQRSAGDEIVPRMAVAAATAGDAKCVREPLP